MNVLQVSRAFFARPGQVMQDVKGGKMATLAQLEGQIQKLQRRADALREKKSGEVIAKIRAMMDEFGITTDDLAKAGSGTGKKRGRPAGAGNASSAKKKTASRLPPKYRDPVSGATWSGHARPPAWIKDAPDRSAFLIDGAAGSASGSSAGRKSARAASRAGRTASKKAAKRTGRKTAKKATRKNGRSAAG
ncbi:MULTISPECIES: H-NS family nucleoid-associated regulatory protein [unclassified Caballeronia]|uniref:H-NS histone family protein n=1 Tax=unclassified Caballeronia TaxID=2646786 RepID=UPI001F2A84AE|nr:MULTISPECIES: H-NS histone family protein [unclassified Caballeronia]MCE4546701.1 H-NS histone family protein [Caballeronia sp. PC1]MCE4572826.1 H-NS histone family protein [Caballeronia sp. CLC5]